MLKEVQFFDPRLPTEECCVLTRYDDRVTTLYRDGAESSNWPLVDDPAYREIAASLYFDTSTEGLLDYCFEHEFFHSFLPMVMFGRASYVVWNSAHGLPGRVTAAQMEEKMVYYFQRYFHYDTSSIDPNWIHYRAKAEQMLGICYKWSRSGEAV